jgi:hypothetical protein
MRVEICDVQLHAPSPVLSKVIEENAELKTRNNTLMYVTLGSLIVGIIVLAVVIDRNEKMKRMNGKGE